MKKIHLFAIDVQFDFCNPKGALYVTGAEEDTKRLAAMVNRLTDKIDDIHVTLDSHNEVDIAHPIFWKDENGKHPNPFTIITANDVINGKWQPTLLACKKRATDYVKQLEANGRYPLCIWPPHCTIGTVGNTIMKPFDEALASWCKKRFKKVDYQVKGSNPFTEHYSVFKADVIDNADPSTMLNTSLIDAINVADEIIIAGQARSHCVANSIRDLIDHLGEDSADKFILLEDAMSDVAGFESFGNDFFNDMKNMGMRTSTTTDYLS